MEFKEFKKIPRLSREMIVTEKIDGSNAQIYIVKEEELKFIEDYFFIEDYLITRKDNLLMFAGSRNRWLKIGKNSDNMGFASWVNENAEELFELGEGRHYGEWYGKGIQCGYGLDHKRLALFNVSKWHDKRLEKRLIKVNEKTGEETYTSIAPNCCEVVPILYQGNFSTYAVDQVIMLLKEGGSVAVQGFMQSEGIVIYHTASGQYFKKTILNDSTPKGLVK